jgi:glycosyltransferase involved in cell wall biosynthesis
VKSLSEDATLELLFVGRLVEHKGLQVLLDAIRRLNAYRSNLLLRLTVVGDGECRSKLERLAAGTGCTFVGFQPNVVPYYEAADIFISPSLGPEGSSLVALEAMARSTACILSDLPVHCEIAIDGKAARLFRSGDIEDLAMKLAELSTNDSERDNYGRSGYLAVQKNHNPETAVRAYLKVFGA